MQAAKRGLQLRSVAAALSRKSHGFARGLGMDICAPRYITLTFRRGCLRNRISSLVRPRDTLMQNAMRILENVPGTPAQKESWTYCSDYLQRTLQGQTVQEGRISEPLSHDQLEDIREAFETANWYEFTLDDRSPEEAAKARGEPTA